MQLAISKGEVQYVKLPFCIICARENPESSTKPSEQYTIGYPLTCALPSTKLESEKREHKIAMNATFKRKLTG